nr:immunoglobulin light chain junction region [Macaca mulatta]
CMQGIRLPYTF